MKSRGEITYEALCSLRDALPLLQDALQPGTPRRWSQHDLTPEQRERMDALVFAERAAKTVNAARGIAALAAARAPLSIDVLDVLTDIEAAIADLEGAVAARLGLTPLAGATTAQRITRLATLINRVDAVTDLAEHVCDEVTRMSQQARRALGDAEAVHRLNARCPICDAMSLRAFPERELVVCVNTTCRCSDEDCPCRWERPLRHRWVRDQWSWLSQVLGEDLQEAS